MFEHKKDESVPLFYLRLTAKMMSLVTIIFILLFLLGEGIDTTKIELKEWIGFLFFPVGLIVGLVIAWRNEGLGGAISMFNLLAFYLIYGLILNGRIWQGWTFILFATPSFLFFAYWLFSIQGKAAWRHI